MDLKALLGDKYKDGMTLEEVAAAVADIDPTAGMVKKELMDKAASEAAEFKRQLSAKQTDEEKAAADKVALETRLKELERNSTVSAHKARLIGLGYDEELAAITAEALASGDTDKVFAGQKSFLEAREKALKAELLKETPKPPAPGEPSAEKSDSVKLAETLGKANAENNKAAGDIISQYAGGNV